ncbi:hypothetical protein VBD025_14230 [Virgibacillus flavescens]|uniref:hypothetical protein n=1 Tax=Virgibacillus flavescens TaxID=1611422 RepID=UPI003D357739
MNNFDKRLKHQLLQKQEKIPLLVQRRISSTLAALPDKKYTSSHRKFAFKYTLSNIAVLLFAFVALYIIVFGNNSSVTNVPSDSGNWEVSEVFTIKEGAQFIGTKGEIAFIANEFKADHPTKTRWFFWGDELHEVNEEKFRLIGVSKNTGEEIILHESDAWGIVNPMYQEESLTTQLNAKSSQHTLITIPTSGKWRLNAFIGEKQYGSIVIDVK